MNSLEYATDKFTITVIFEVVDKRSKSFHQIKDIQNSYLVIDVDSIEHLKKSIIIIWIFCINSLLNIPY